MSRGEDPVELGGEEDACSGADRGSTSAESVPPSIAAAESPSFLTWLWIQIVTACSGVVWGATGGGVSGPGMLGRASGPQQHSLQEDSESEVLSRIAASKSTWSEVPGRHTHHFISSVPCPSQLSVWEELKESAPSFFRDDLVEVSEVGRLIAEGGQAQIYEAKLEGVDFDLVLKVFNLDAGLSLADLKRHWPRTMSEDGDSDCRESRPGQERSCRFVFDNVASNFTRDRCWILGATLLKDGRFAFLMRKHCRDLRTLIDLKVEHNTHLWEFDLLLQPLFSFHDSVDIMSQIARG